MEDNRIYKDLKDDEKVKVLNEILKMNIDDNYKVFKIQSFILNWLSVSKVLSI